MKIEHMILLDDVLRPVDRGHGGRLLRHDQPDPDNADAILWAMAYRMNPVEDVQALPHRGQGHGPKREHDREEDSTLLMDATMKGNMPPLALPKREYMENAKALWERLGLPALKPQTPWHGYDLGHWPHTLEEQAQRATRGDYFLTGEEAAKRRRDDVKMNEPVTQPGDNKPPRDDH